jgi:hypothetical protein
MAATGRIRSSDDAAKGDRLHPAESRHRLMVNSKIGRKSVQEKWLVKMDDAVIGPLTDDEFVYLLTHGDIQPDTHVKLVGQSGWISANQIPDATIYRNSIEDQNHDDVSAFYCPSQSSTNAAQVYHIFTYVAGIHYSNSDGTSRQDFAKTLYIGQPLELYRDRDNARDANAVKLVMSNEQQIGFLPRRVALEVAPLHELGWKYGCHVVGIQEEWEYDHDDNETERISADLLLIGAGPSATDADAQAYFNSVVRHIMAIRYPEFPLVPISGTSG